MLKYICLRNRVKKYLKEFYHRNAVGDYVDSDGDHVVHQECIPIITAMLMTRNYELKSIDASKIEYEIHDWKSNYYCDPVSCRQYKDNMQRLRNYLSAKGLPGHKDDSLRYDDLTYLARYLPPLVSDSELESILQEIFAHQIAIQKRLAPLSTSKINK